MAQKPLRSGQDIMRDALRAHAPIVVLCVMLSGMSSLLMLTAPIYMLNIYNRVLSSHSMETLIVISTIAVFAYAMLCTFDYLRGRLVSRIVQRCRAAFPERFLLTPAETQGQPQAIERVDSLCAAIDSPLASAIFDVPWAPIYFGLLFVFHPALGWLGIGGAIVVATLHFSASWAGGRARRHAAKSKQIAEHHVAAIKAQSAQPSTAMLSQWRTLDRNAKVWKLRSDDFNALSNAATRFTKLILQSAALGVGAWLVLRGDISAGTMLAGSILVSRALSPIDALLTNWPRLSSARQDWDELDRYPAPSRLNTHSPSGPLVIEANDLTYVPPGARKPALRQLNFRFTAGQTIAIIGDAGAGKTCLMELISGKYRPSAGSLRIAGIPANKPSFAAQSGFIGISPEAPTLMPGSVLDNISDFTTPADPDAISVAVEIAQLNDTISQLPDGIDSWIAPYQPNLSSLEVARIALARAIYRDPRILLIDGLPWHNNSTMLASIARLIAHRNERGLITIITDQDPSRIVFCDHIVRLNRGSIVSSTATTAGHAIAQ